MQFGLNSDFEYTAYAAAEPGGSAPGSRPFPLFYEQQFFMYICVVW